MTLTRTAGLLTGITTQNGRSLVVTNNASNRISQITDALTGRVWTYTYDAAGLLWKVTTATRDMNSSACIFYFERMYVSRFFRLSSYHNLGLTTDPHNGGHFIVTLLILSWLVTCPALC
ncbi:MAG: hypothetical protein IPP12_17420 [Nitrospira sp.]|nr:hypothetical protein [Nitrospira sp.]